MSDEKEYTVPIELCDIMEEALATEDARDSAVKGFFKYQLRNAITLSVMARKKRTEFWNGIYELYPNLAGKNVEFDSITKMVKLKAPDVPQ